jgi:CHAT domain-containing protein
VGTEATSLQFALSEKDGVKCFVLDVGEAGLQQQVTAWRDAVRGKGERREEAASRALYDALFAGVEKAGLLAPERAARLVLVGDGPLLEVPFAALLDSAGKRLAERFPIAVSQSLGVLGWTGDQAKPSVPLLVVADPGKDRAKALPAFRAEGQSVAQLVAGSHLLVGTAATKREVLADMPASGALHFATHAVLDAPDSLKCGLRVSEEKGADGEPVLTAQDILGTQLAARLAVLSACDTGQGEQIAGEGLLGLTWAFRAAGCPSTVASLWSVDDEAAGRLIARFYQELKGGKRKDDALRAAMLAVKQEKPQPFYWAAFQLIGDASALRL